MKQLLLVLVMASAGLAVAGQETAAALGERFQKTRAPADKLAWHQALEREGHDFSKRARTPVDARGVYKLNRTSRLACLVFRKTDRAGDSWDEDLGPDGTLHVEWKRKPNGGNALKAGFRKRLGKHGLRCVQLRVLLFGGGFLFCQAAAGGVQLFVRFLKRRAVRLCLRFQRLPLSFQRLLLGLRAFAVRKPKLFFQLRNQVF